MSQQQEELSANLAIRVAPSMLDRLRAEAQVQDRPVGWLVRKAITEMLSTEKDQ